MTLSAVQRILRNSEKINFRLPNGTLVPEHFHVTEIGRVSKHFIDFGGTIRTENVVNFQLWNANDYNHRLHPEKLLQIIDLSIEKLGLKDEEIEVEYQGITIEKYALEFNGNDFLLVSKQTDCLAPDKCGIPSTEKPRIKLSELASKSCHSASGCC